MQTSGNEPGFFGSWYTTRVSGVHAKNDTCSVSYEELLEEDGSHVTESAVVLHRLRPVLADWLAERKLSNKVRFTLPGVPGGSVYAWDCVLALALPCAAFSRAALTARPQPLSSYTVLESVEVLYEEGWCERCTPGGT